MVGRDRPILVAWEQGGNLGHLLRIKAIVELMQRQRREVILAVSQVLGSQFSQELEGIPCVKVVISETGRAKDEAQWAPVASFAGVLARQGWSDANWLHRSTKAWMDLCLVTKPVAIVLDYAPVASLVACILRIAALQVSSGFDAPPAASLGIGRFRSRTGDISLAEVAEVSAVDASIARVISTRGVEGPAPRLRQVLAHPIRLLDCIAQTDPYGAREDANYVPFLSTPSHTEPAVWPGEQSGLQNAKAFVYIRNNDVAEHVLQALSRKGVPTLCFWPGYESTMHFKCGDTVDVHAQPLDVHAVLLKASLVVSYGSVGVSTRAVLAGVPQIVLPPDAEKGMVAKRLHEQRLGIYLDMKHASSGIDRALDQIIGTDLYLDACKKAQRKLQSEQAGRSFGGEVDRAIEQLIGTRP